MIRLLYSVSFHKKSMNQFVISSANTSLAPSVLYMIGECNCGSSKPFRQKFLPAGCIFLYLEKDVAWFCNHGLMPYEQSITFLKCNAHAKALNEACGAFPDRHVRAQIPEDACGDFRELLTGNRLSLGIF